MSPAFGSFPVGADYAALLPIGGRRVHPAGDPLADLFLTGGGGVRRGVAIGIAIVAW